MLKKIAAVGVLSVIAFAAQANPGCGLGSQVWKGQDGVVPHVLAATTNGTSGNQTFGMTSGTLGCDASKPIQSAALFLNDNIDQVAENMATGRGEALTTFAELMGVAEADQAEFITLTQANFGKIFTNGAITTDEVMTNLVNVMQSTDKFANIAG